MTKVDEIKKKLESDNRWAFFEQFCEATEASFIREVKADIAHLLAEVERLEKNGAEKSKIIDSFFSSVRKFATPCVGTPAWSVVGNALSVGSTSGGVACERLGIDPELMVGQCKKWKTCDAGEIGECEMEIEADDV